MSELLEIDDSVIVEIGLPEHFLPVAIGLGLVVLMSFKTVR